MKDLGLYQTFSKVIHVSNVSRGNEIMSVVEQLDCFSKQELDYLQKNLKEIPVINKNEEVFVEQIIDIKDEMEKLK